MRLRDTYMHYQMRTLLVQIMACPLFGASPVSEPMLDYCQLDPCEHISAKFLSKYSNFHWRKCIWICCIRNGGHLVSASMCSAKVLKYMYTYIDGILPKRPYPLGLHMADRALLAGNPWYVLNQMYSVTSILHMICIACFMIDEFAQFVHPHHSRLHHWHLKNHMIATMPVKQP